MLGYAPPGHLAVACPFLVQLGANERLQTLCLPALLALVEMPVGLVKQRAAVSQRDLSSQTDRETGRRVDVQPSTDFHRRRART
jgi:hypothetical protein